MFFFFQKFVLTLLNKSRWWKCCTYHIVLQLVCTMYIEGIYYPLLLTSLTLLSKWNDSFWWMKVKIALVATLHTQQELICTKCWWWSFFKCLSIQIEVCKLDGWIRTRYICTNCIYVVQKLFKKSGPVVFDLILYFMQCNINVPYM